jgi:LppP/LprE lipoprotein
MPRVAHGVQRCLPVVVLAVCLAGCGGGTKTVIERTKTVTVPATQPTTSPPEPPTPPPAASAPPSRASAELYARRTYVVQPQLGKRVFRVEGPRASVTAADGSLITGYGAVLADSGDGTGQAVLLFRGPRFLGWATAHLAVRLSVHVSGGDIAVRYGDFQGNDPLCCPSSTKTVRYSWNGARVVADGDPPHAYGKLGDQLHLAPGG